MPDDLLLTGALAFLGFVLCALAFATGWHFGWWRGHKAGIRAAQDISRKRADDMDHGRAAAVAPWSATIPTPGAWPRSPGLTS